ADDTPVFLVGDRDKPVLTLEFRLERGALPGKGEEGFLDLRLQRRIQVVREAIARRRKRLGFVDRADLRLVHHIAFKHAEHYFVGDRGRVIVLVGNADHRVVVLAGEYRLVVALRDQMKLRFEQCGGRLESGIRRGRGEGKFLALYVGRRLDRAVGRYDDFHLVAEISVLAGHDGERHEAGAVHCDRIGAGVETRNVQATRAHGLDLGRVRLHREEHDLFAGYLFHVLDEPVPNLGVDRRVLDRGICKNQRRRIDELLGVARRVGHQVAVAVAIRLVEIAARTILGAGHANATQYEYECDEDARDDAE